MAVGAGTSGGWSVQDFPDGVPLAGARLDLEPLQAAHAEQMAPLLNDPALHVSLGGEAASLPELRERYRRQATGRSSDRSQRWLNWVLRRRADAQGVGTVQATVIRERDVLVAEVAWVVATPYQGSGYAREAAATAAAWLRERGVSMLVAHVHPDHQASQGVARALGLVPTATVIDGETRWQS